MKTDDYGRCDTCGVALTRRYHGFSRQIAQCEYPVPAGTEKLHAVLHVLYEEQLTQYCGAACATVGAYSQLQDRRIEGHGVAPGPMAPCSKCGMPVDLMQPHVAYEMMEQTEIRQLWLTTVEPHDSETLAWLCQACDGDVAFESLNAETADPVAPALPPTMTV
jgi:hypothetical protein